MADRLSLEDLGLWLDRKSPGNLLRSWRDWFTADGEYLGEVSARTGPDKVMSDQRCNCEVCNAGRER